MTSEINTLRSLLTAIGLCILSGPLTGQQAEGQMAYTDTLEIYPVTVIALRPHAARSESLELDYQDRMAHDAGALLSQIAAIGSIKKSGGYGFDPVFRGFKYEQLNLVLDGAQTASAACPNRMDPPTSQMAPNMIRKIEILKGPYALRFGNSFGGTINFITAQPSFPEKKEGYGRVSGRYDSNGNILRTEGMAGFRSPRINLGLFAAWSEGNDYRSGGDQVIPAGFLRASFGTRLGILVSGTQNLTLSVTRNLARDSDFASLPMDLRADNTWMFSASHELYPSSGSLKSWQTTLYGSLVDHLMDNLLKPLDPRTMNATTRANTANYGMRSEGTWAFQRSRLYTGLDFRYEGAEGLRTRQFLMGPNAGTELIDNVWQGGQIQRAGLFAEYHLQGRQIRWVISGRLNLNHAGISDPDPDFVNLYPVYQSTQLNPAVSLGVSRNLSETISMGVWLGRVQRSGSLTERYINYFPVGLDPYEMLGNPMLDQEINYETDLSIQYLSERSAFHLDLFAAYLENLISSLIDTSLTPRLPGSPGVRQYTNIGQAFKTGFEFSWEQKWPAGLQHQFSIAYTYGKDLERNDPLPEIAPLDMRFHLSGSYLSNRLKPYLMVRHAMKQNRISMEFGETMTPSFTLVDLGLSFRFTPSVSSTAGIQNLFDTLYYEHLSRSVRGMDETPIYAPGRCFFLSVSLNFM